MVDTKRPWSDHKVDNIIGALLRFGVILSAVIVLVGGIFYLVHHSHYGSTISDYHQFHGEPSDLSTIGGIFRDAFALRATGIIQLGLLVLIATPVARVVFTILAFAFQGDYMYMIVTLVVLGVLLYSLAAVH